jgi:hypothetical protein
MEFMQTAAETAWGRYHRSVVRLGVRTATAGGQDCSYKAGTGVVIDDLLIITCSHLLMAAKEGEVSVPNSQPKKPGALGGLHKTNSRAA